MDRMRLSGFAPGPPASGEEVAAIADLVANDADGRFAALASAMEARGESALAALFRHLRAEGRPSATAVRKPPGAGAAAPWRRRAEARAVPILTELAAAWDEAAGSALVTPYRALATAVANQERLFAFFAYLAAHAADPRAAADAERQAGDALRRAASLRRRRRAAYHRERTAGRPPPPPRVDGVDTLAALLARHELAIAACHSDLAARLERAGDAEAAALLRAGHADRHEPEAGSIRNDGGAAAPAALLLAAQRPLESLAEILERLAATASDEAVRLRAQDHLRTLVARIAPIAGAVRQRLERLTDGRPGPGAGPPR